MWAHSLGHCCCDIIMTIMCNSELCWKFLTSFQRTSATIYYLAGPFVLGEWLSTSAFVWSTHIAQSLRMCPEEKLCEMPKNSNSAVILYMHHTHVTHILRMVHTFQFQTVSPLHGLYLWFESKPEFRPFANRRQKSWSRRQNIYNQQLSTRI